MLTGGLALDAHASITQDMSSVCFVISRLVWPPHPIAAAAKTQSQRLSRLRGGIQDFSKKRKSSTDCTTMNSAWAANRFTWLAVNAVASPIFCITGR